jgi:hypothetical protein
MRTNQALSHRAQTSTNQPVSCTHSLSQSSASGAGFGSNHRNAKTSAAQSARRLHAKISSAGLPLRDSRGAIAGTPRSRSR